MLISDPVVGMCMSQLTRKLVPNAEQFDSECHIGSKIGSLQLQSLTPLHAANVERVWGKI